MGASINLCVSAADVRSETSKFETAEALSSGGQGVRCTDKINGGTVKNDDASVARKDIALEGVAALGHAFVRGCLRVFLA